MYNLQKLAPAMQKHPGAEMQQNSLAELVCCNWNEDSPYLAEMQFQKIKLSTGAVNLNKPRLSSGELFPSWVSEPFKACYGAMIKTKHYVLHLVAGASWPTIKGSLAIRRLIHNTLVRGCTVVQWCRGYSENIVLLKSLGAERWKE